ncbi:MAG: AAA family ATPase [Bacteroidales bacterium]|nr:AAA family ATPase [Bacteroidales bacterium]
MQPLKYAFKHVRVNTDQIYKGFGLCHLDDVTQYYVHPDNQSYKGTTTICQAIGDAVILCSELISSKNNIGDIFFSENNNDFFVDINIPEDWRDNFVFEFNVFNYKVLYSYQNIKLACYDKNKKFIKDDFKHFHPKYKICLVLAVILSKQLIEDEDFRSLFVDFISQPTKEKFIIICENFYQVNKDLDIELDWNDLSKYEIKTFKTFSNIYKNIKNNTEDIKTEFKKIEIEKFLDTDFSEEQKLYIPNLAKEFVLDSSLHNLCNAIKNNDIKAVLFHGPSGTGKTISCKLICQEINLPILETVNCTENLDEYVLGKYIPLDDKIIFKESYVTKAIREGGAVVFEEINFAKPQYLSFLNSLLDDNGFVRLDNGEIVKRHKNFRFFATMNIGYFGTKELNQALYNRFNAIIEIPSLSNVAIKRMLVARVPESEKYLDKVLNIYHKIKKRIEVEELDYVISPRTLENWLKLAKYEGYIKSAEKTIIQIAKNDKAFSEVIRSIIKIYKW